MEKQWKVLGELATNGRQLTAESVVEVLLKNREITDPDPFFSPPKPDSLIPRLSDYLPDLDLDQLDRATARIKLATAGGEKISIWGDYDVDGIASTAVLWETLNALGANALPYIPDRLTEGYGLSREGIKELAGSGAKLIITVDSGITALEEVAYANSLGLEVIVTDHHVKPASGGPPAYAIVHTTKLCGAGISWLLSSYLTAHSSRRVADSLDLVAIATVADIQPLLGINRSLVKYGFEILNRNERPGLAALIEVAGLKPGALGSYAAGWVLGPRLNAVGRMGEGNDSGGGAIEALRLLCVKSIDKARGLAHLLESANKKRQVLTLEALGQAKDLVAQPLTCPADQLIVVYDDSWHEGVIGLVAGRLVEECGRPAVVIAKGEEFSKGSARSVNGFNILEALRSQSDLLEDVGGHAAAAGFTVANSNLERFIASLREGTAVELAKLDPRPVLKIDAELPLQFLGHHLATELEKFEPCGLGNPEPTFVAHGVNVLEERKVGRQKQHLKLSVSPGWEAVWFGHGDEGGFTRGEEISLVYTPEIDAWDGKERVTLRIRDLKRHNISGDDFR